MSEPIYRTRPDNQTLTDTYIDKTIGSKNISNSKEPNDSGFLSTYPKQGRRRPVPSPSPTPAEKIYRFYATGLFANTPGGGFSTTDFKFVTHSSYPIYLDNFFMQPTTYYIDNKSITYHLYEEKFIQDLGFLFILDDDNVPYYMSAAFNEAYSLVSNFTISKRKNKTFYYQRETTSALAANMNFTVRKINNYTPPYITRLTPLEILLPNFRDNRDFTLFHNFRFYNTNLKLIKRTLPNGNPVYFDPRDIADQAEDEGEFKQDKNFGAQHVVNYDNFDQIEIGAAIIDDPSESFDRYPTNIDPLKRNLYVYNNTSYYPYYINYTEPGSDNVYLLRRLDETVPEDYQDDYGTLNVTNDKYYFKLVSSPKPYPQSSTESTYVTNLNTALIYFTKPRVIFNLGQIRGFYNPKPQSLPIVTRLGVYKITNLTIEEILDISGYTYFVQSTIGTINYYSASKNKYDPIPPTDTVNNKMGVIYTATEINPYTSGTNGPTSKFKAGSTLNISNAYPRANLQAQLDQENTLITLYRSYLTEFVKPAYKKGTNFNTISANAILTDKNVYIIIESKLVNFTTILKKFYSTILYIRNPTNDKFYKLTPIDPGTIKTDVNKIYSFWKVSDEKGAKIHTVRLKLAPSTYINHDAADITVITTERRKNILKINLA